MVKGASFGPGSRPSDQAASRLAATRVDPSRGDIRATAERLRIEFEMTERVAKAMFLADHPNAKWSAGRARAVWFSRAAAAIRAMYEPTRTVAAAGIKWAEEVGVASEPILVGYQRMVKAATFPCDSDQSGEAGQTPQAAGPEGRERGPEGHRPDIAAIRNQAFEEAARETVSEILDRHIVLQEWPGGDGWQIVGLDQAAREIVARYALKGTPTADGEGQ